MKQAVIAAGLSLALHAVVLVVFLHQAAPTVVAVAAPREKPVQVEVMRLTGLVNSPKRAAPVVAEVAPAVVARRPVSKPEPGGTVAIAEAPAPGPEEKAPVEGGAVGGVAPSPGDSEDLKPEPAAPLDTSALSARLQQVALRCYPAAARRFRQTGEAQIRFCVDAAGALREQTIVRSTGSELLDHAAADCVIPGAAPFGPETHGRCFTVPVRFNN